MCTLISYYPGNYFIKPIYEDLNKSLELLEGCLGGFTRNNNGSMHQLIWKIPQKIFWLVQK